MGRATCFVAEDEGRVVGTLAAVVRDLMAPDGTPQRVAYLADLRVAQSARGGRTLFRLARVAESWLRPMVESAFSVVMDGTRATPLEYTGRAGLLEFRELATVVVLRIPAGRLQRDASGTKYGEDGGEGEQLFHELSTGRYATAGGAAATRSAMAPVWLVREDGAACGRLEDTRRAKRLWADDGAELVSAHLSCFAFRTPGAGAELIHEARHRCADLGLPALFVAVAVQDAASLQETLGDVGQTVAPATVFGAGIETGCPWNINTAEI